MLHFEQRRHTRNDGVSQRLCEYPQLLAMPLISSYLLSLIYFSAFQIRHINTEMATHNESMGPAFRESFAFEGHVLHHKAKAG